MNLTDEDISGLTRDWVEERMPTEAQIASTSRMISYYLATPEEQQATLDYARRISSAFAKRASHDEIEEELSILENDIVNLLPHLHHDATRRLHDEFTIIIANLKGDVGPLTDDQHKRLMDVYETFSKHQRNA